MISLENNEQAREDVNETVATMATIMNYLGVSMYEGSFKQCHQDALKVMNTIYETAAHKPGVPPSAADGIAFYNNLTFLASVTDTDDPDYWTFKKKLKRCITSPSSSSLHSA